MINLLIQAIKAAGLNHKQINEILVSVEADISANEDTNFPLLRVWPQPFHISTDAPRETVYRFGLAVINIHRSDFTDAIEGISDASQIIHDLHASLNYMYVGTNMKWFISDDAQPLADAQLDIVSGVGVILECRVPYTGNFCWVPSNDYAFPNMNLDILTILDGGDAFFDLELETADGGTA